MTDAAAWEMNGSEIAIIGVAGRFPGARTIEEFWHNLQHGVESVTVFSDADLAEAGIDPALIRDPDYVKAGAILEDIDLFDAGFFGFSPREASLLDPQQRIFLECSWEALEHAGYDAEQSPGAIGVFAGVGLNTYLLNNVQSQRDPSAPFEDFQSAIANDKDFLATRISYKLGLEGPSLTVQTACSTSLVAVHLACQSLISGECDMALAGGVSVRVPHKAGFLYQEGGIASRDGHCRAFDAAARGTVFGNGAGVVVLRRLEDALDSGDTIYAVIKGSAINNDGALKAGYTAPREDGQARVIRAAQAIAAVTPDTISYIEAHGTGTALGDPIEVAALTQVFQRQTQRRTFCALGSLKTNIGHLDTAAGIAGLIKTVLALQHQQIPPTLHYSAPNPQIDFASSPFYVNTQLQPWLRNGAPRRAGVSSFGIGGTNAHVIVEEAPPPAPSDPAGPWQVLLLSARTASALETATTQLAAYLRRHPDVNLADVAYTLQVGRRVFSHRRAVICRDVADAIEVLETGDAGRIITSAEELTKPSIVLMFSGQGTQYAGMSRELYAEEPAFRAAVDQCCALLQPLLDRDLRALLYPAPADEAAAHELLRQTALAQPALFVVEYALAQLVLSWGLRPAALLGHSLGELVAATLAGVFALPDALQLVVARGALMQQCPPGAMLAVELSAALLQPWLEPDLALAAVNGPAQCVVAGPPAAIAALEARLAPAQIRSRRLSTTHAFHSALLDGAIAPFSAAVAAVPRQAPQIPLLSNVTGDWLDQAATEPAYWGQQLRQPVQFAAELARLAELGPCVLLELGPGQTLATLARQSTTGATTPVVLATLRGAQGGAADGAAVRRALSGLWLAGAVVPWAALHAGARRQRLPLPSYPFERQRYWIAPRRGLPASTPASADGALRKRPEVADWFALPSWRRAAPRLAPALAEVAAGTRWLLLVDAGGVGAALAARLRQAGQGVVTVQPGAAFAAAGPDAFQVRPDQGADYRALLQALAQDGGLPTRIVHLWSLREADGLAAQLAHGVHSLLALAQALGEVGGDEPRQLLVVTQQQQQVAGEALEPAQALLRGPCLVIPQEYPQLRCRSIDLEQRGAGPVAEAVITQLLAEVGSAEEAGLVAYRGGQRWLPDFTPVRLAAVPAGTGLRPQGVYLITGGLGGVGLALAGYLAATVQARLALVGRRGLPAREQWATWLAEHAAADAVSAQIRQVQALEAAGAEVLVLAADVTDARALRAALATVRARWGALHGVIHAAGFPGGGLIQFKTQASVESVLAAKVQGTMILHELLRDEPLDFLLLCSSLNAIIGGPGLVDYSAANAFLDAFAQHHASHRGPHIVAVAWDRWEQVGMAANAASPFARLYESPGLSLHPVEHPLLQHVAAIDSATAVYPTRLRVAQHWVLAEHHVAGRPTIPGATYPELAQATFAQQTGVATVEIREMVFITPLVTDDQQQRMMLTMLEQQGADYRFRVVSRSEGAAHAEWQEHVSARLRSLPSAPSPQHDLQAIIARCTEDDTAPTRYAAENDAARFVARGPRWHTLRRVFVGHDERLGLFELAPQFAADLRSFTLHPALLDVATGYARPAGDEHYLPFAYERICVRGALPATIYSHVRYKSVARAQADVVICDITLMDDQGIERVLIEGFTLRRLGDETLAGLKAGPTRMAAGGGRAQALSDEFEPIYTRLNAQPESASILPAEGVEAFARVLAHRTLSQIVVSTRPIDAVVAQAQTLTQDGLFQTLAQPTSDKLAQRRPELNSQYTPPSNQIEQTIAAVWQKLLGIDQIGIYDNFFELGGDSLIGIRVIAELKQQLNMDIPAVSLFEAPTISALTKYLQPQQSSQASLQHTQDRADKKREVLERQRRLNKERKR